MQLATLQDSDGARKMQLATLQDFMATCRFAAQSKAIKMHKNDDFHKTGNVFVWKNDGRMTGK